MDEKESISPITKIISETNRLFDEGRKAYMDGEYDKAIGAFLESYRLNNNLNRNLDDNKILFNLFEAYNQAGDEEKASKIIKQIIEVFPDKELVKFEHGLELLKGYLNDEDKITLAEALKVFNELIVMNSKDPDYWYYNGYCKSLFGSDVEAEKDFKMVMLLSPEYRDVHSIDSFKRLKRSLGR